MFFFVFFLIDVRKYWFLDTVSPHQLLRYHLVCILHTLCYVPQIFSNDGQFKSRFGVRGRTPGQLQRPTGVAVHPNGDIIIADYDNKWVSIFSSEGKFKVCCAVTVQ